MAFHLNKELVLLALQFLKEEKLDETAHMLEQETGIYFDLNYFEHLVMAGKFDEAERYLSGFTSVNEHIHSKMIFLYIRKQNYLETLDRKDFYKATEILVHDLKMFKEIDSKLYPQLEDLIYTNDFRKHEGFRHISYDTEAQRALVFLNIKNSIEKHPFIREKLTWPGIENSRLRVLINHSVNWQHSHCKSPQSNPKVRTLFVDHTCEPLDGTPTPSPSQANNPPMASRVPFPLNPTAYNRFQGAVAPTASSFTGWGVNLNTLPATPSAVTFGSAAAVPSGSTAAVASDAFVSTPNIDALLKRPRNPSPPKGGTDNQFSDSEHILKRFRASKINEVENKTTNSLHGFVEVPSVNPIHTAHRLGHVPGAPENSERALPEALINSVDSNGMMLFKQRIHDEGVNKRKNWKFVEVTNPDQCRSMKLQDPKSTEKITSLHYTSKFPWLLSLDADAKHKLWKWESQDRVTTKIAPESGGEDIRNDTSGRGSGEADSFIAVSINGLYVSSCSGGEVSLFDLETCKVLRQFVDPPQAATFIAFHPENSNIVAIGMEDATIQIFNLQSSEIIAELQGHAKRITGLAFSQLLQVLVSSGSDGQLCVWGINGWEKQKSKSVHSASSIARTRVQFHKDQVHLLVVQDIQISIYDVSKLECLCHWAPENPTTAAISSATFSCDCLLVYASFCDGSVCVFDAEILKPRCRIVPSAFMPGITSGNTYPLVIAANPKDPNQFVIGMTDGSVYVIEPVESEEEKWPGG